MGATVKRVEVEIRRTQTTTLEVPDDFELGVETITDPMWDQIWAREDEDSNTESVIVTWADPAQVPDGTATSAVPPSIN